MLSYCDTVTNVSQKAGLHAVGGNVPLRIRSPLWRHLTAFMLLIAVMMLLLPSEAICQPSHCVGSQ